MSGEELEDELMDDNTLEAFAVVGIVVLGVVAIIWDGNVGETIAVGVAATLGALATHLWYRKAV